MISKWSKSERSLGWSKLYNLSIYFLGVIRFEVRDVKSDATLLVYIPPSPPKHVRIVKAKHDWAILQWDAPSTLGSLPIIGYVLEVRVEDQKWAPIGPSLILGARTEIDGLEGGVEHRFRVKAVTEHGLAAASVTTDPLIPWVSLHLSRKGTTLCSKYHFQPITNCASSIG